MIPNYPLISLQSPNSIEFGQGLRANGVGWGRSVSRILSSRPTQAAAQRKLSGFFVPIRAELVPARRGTKKPHLRRAQVAAALLRPPTPRISELKRANPVILSKQKITSIKPSAPFPSRSEKKNLLANPPLSKSYNSFPQSYYNTKASNLTFT